MHGGHRKRIDEKVRLFGFEGLSEYEQLEQLLYVVIPRKNTNFLAHELIDKYGTLSGVLSADVKDLENMDGIGHRTAVFLTTLPELMGAVHRSTFNPARLTDQKKLEEYVQTFFFGKLVETAYAIFLNSLDGVIGFERLSVGIASETYIYPVQVAKKAIVSNASKVVIAHNHPCGVSKPSQQDMSTTRRVLKALHAIEIELRDSLIVAKGECFSMREHGYLVLDDIRY